MKRFLLGTLGITFFSFLACKSHQPTFEITKIYEDSPNNILLKHDSSALSPIRLQVHPTGGTFETDENLIGYGVNTATLAIKGQLVENDSAYIDPSDKTNGQRTAYNLYRVTSKEDLYHDMGVDIKTSMSFGPFSGNASLNMINESSINSYSDFLLLQVIVVNTPTIIKKTKLTSDALMVAQTDVKKFKERYGNEYFYAKRSGGEFCALFEFTSTTAASKSAVSAKVEASIGFLLGGGDVSAKMNDLQTSLTENTSVKIKLLRIGDQGAIAGQDIRSIVNYALRFPDSVKANVHPYILGLDSKEIITAPGIPIAIGSDDYLDFNSQSLFLDSIARAISKIEDLNANYSYASNPSNGDYFSTAAIDSSRKLLDENKNAIEHLKLLYNNCVTSINQCALKTEPVRYNTYVPAIKIAVPNIPKAIPKSVVVSNTEQQIAEVPFGRTMTIECRGLWRIDGHGHDYGPDYGCGLPRSADILNTHLASKIRIIQRSIDNGFPISDDVIVDNSPFTTRQGVKVYVVAQYPIIQCDPPVTAYAY